MKIFGAIPQVLERIKEKIAFFPAYAIRLKCKRVRSQNEFIENIANKYNNEKPWQTLDLGCGLKARNPFKSDVVLGIDIRENSSENIMCTDLSTQAIPIKNSTLDFVTAFDFIEHVQRVSLGTQSRFPFVELMSEIHRVLKVGGYFFSRTPAFPFKEAFQDPTHVNIITEETFPLYFCHSVFGPPMAHMYGFKGTFRIVEQMWHGYHLLTVLEKIETE